MKMHIMNNRWLQIGLRWLLGGIFIYAGVLKILSPPPFADSIATFRLLPAPLINLLALGLPVFEVAVGGLLVVGRYVRAAALGVLVMTGVFAFALASALARGLPVDCGCFGSKAASAGQAWVSLRRDLLLGAAAWLLYRHGLSTVASFFPRQVVRNPDGEAANKI